MSQLVSVAEFRTRFGLNDAPDVNAYVAASLLAVTPQLEEILQTQFQYKGHTDQYWVNSKVFPFTDQHLKLRLTSGFVDPLVTVVIKNALFLEELASSIALPLTNIKIDNEQGLVYITQIETFSDLFRLNVLVQNSFVQVNYSAGFQTQATEFGPVFMGVPSWLKEACYMMARREYLAATACKKEDLAQINLLTKPYLDSKIRFYPSALRPLI